MQKVSKNTDSLGNRMKIKMELVWHNCKTCLPSEAYNECLYLWNGERVVQAEWYHDAWHYEDGLCDDIMIASEDAEHMWWADLHQTAEGFFKEASES